ncbi:MAG: prepilin peptidase [Hyphomicrobiales bacterium]|nr:prepilin peptidase [Hyphomicrobiales bacterium]MBV9111556.1 prepilin peptidase [Hyphomicrobiales bacterium]MBV9519244.1 prepilin peptidase [Hyphomicrobiales bacterium]
MTSFLFLGVFPALMAFAAAYDLTTMTIPNKLTAAVALAFVAVAGLCHLPASEVAWHLAAGLLVLAVTFAMFAAGWMGGGDAKLAAGIALWLGFADLLDYFMLASILGGVLTVALLLARRYPLPMVLARLPWALKLHAPETGIPYGIALAIAALAILPHTEIMLRAFSN